jgi:transposase InsO family protein
MPASETTNQKHTAKRRGGKHVVFQCHNQRWPVDFVSDELTDGRRFRVLNEVDHFTRECSAVWVDTSLPGQRVQLEFTGHAMDGWARQHGMAERFIEPAQPAGTECVCAQLQRQVLP